MRTIIAMLAMAASSLAYAGGPDHVLVYGDDGNVNYQCQVYHGYIDTEGFGSFYADRCTETGEIPAQFPNFPPVRIYLSLDFAPRKAAFPIQPRIARYCLFVARAFGGPETSTVIDCRSASMAAAP